LNELKADYPDITINSYEVWYHPQNRTLMDSMARDKGFQASGVPITFIGERYWTGFSKEITGAQIREHINLTYQGIESEQKINIPFLGEISSSDHSLFFMTFIIAFVDGFNPCSLWVLTFLLGIVLHSGSRKKIFIVGITYLLVTSFVYGLFIFGLLNVFSYVSYVGWIRLLVGSIAILFALINIKDYFWYKKGISLTISDKAKPGIFKRMRNLMKPGTSTPMLVILTIIMALGITLVELPCTAGFPMIWSQIMAQNNVTGLLLFSLILLYILVYLFDELLVFSAAVITLKASKFEEKHGRLLKLIGGMIMLFLGIAIIFAPEIMNDIKGTILLFGSAILLSLVIMKLFNVDNKGDKNA
jgi:hypothetical protein